MNGQNHIDTPHIDPRVIELLNGDIDGELSESEQQEVTRLLADSESLRNLHNELKTVNGILDATPEIEPPGYLQGTIERQVRLPVTKSGHSDKQRTGNRWLPAHWLRTGFALTIGAVITVGIYQVGSYPFTLKDSEGMVGTMVKSQDQALLLGSIDLKENQLSGLVELTRSNDLFTLDVQLQSKAPSKLVVSFAGQGLEFESTDSQQGQDDSVSVSNDSVSVSGNGRQHYTLKFRRTAVSQSDLPIALEFFTDNMLVHTAEIKVSPQ